MEILSEQGQEIARAAAARHGVSPEAAGELLRALALGGGTQAQFSHPELGGMGQWSRGGMLMIGDMFNNALKAKVDALATDLAGQLGSADVLRRDPASGGASGWPAEFGQPASSGAQNDMRYAFFPGARRLVIARGGATEIYDSGEHVITGVGQQQGSGQDIAFSTPQGPLDLASLRRLDRTSGEPEGPVPEETGETPKPIPREAASSHAAPTPAPSAHPAAPAPEGGRPAAPGGSGTDVLATIERLAELKGRGILSEEEFAAKKAELLGRL